MDTLAIDVSSTIMNVAVDSAMVPATSSHAAQRRRLRAARGGRCGRRGRSAASAVVVVAMGVLDVPARGDAPAKAAASVPGLGRHGRHRRSRMAAAGARSPWRPPTSPGVARLRRAAGDWRRSSCAPARRHPRCRD